MKANPEVRNMQTERLDAETSIVGLEGVTVGDFWSWGYSDIMTNTTRGTFAEYLVAVALGVANSSFESGGWGDFDLLYDDYKVEVKSSAYLQSWEQRKPSSISFDIGARGTWVSETRNWLRENSRSADCYIFCVFKETERSRANVIDTSQWDFYVLPTKLINEEFGTQKSVVLSRVKRLVAPVSIEHLRKTVDRTLGANN